MLTREESDDFVDRIEAEFEQRGFGLWAVEVRGGAPFIGFVGLHVPPFEAHFTPGHRLRHHVLYRIRAEESARQP